jgi:oligopeptide/dipeptide ABC transporter ATP-binding protein
VTENDEFLLEIRDLRLNFATFDGVSKVLAGVYLNMHRGDVLGLVGETGCGKTMTALSIPRLVPCPPGEIVSGEVLFEGQDVLVKTEEEMRDIRAHKIGMIFQDAATSLNPVFTIAEQMTDVIRCRSGPMRGAMSTTFRSLLPLHLKERSAARARAIDLLERVGLPDPYKRIDAYPHEFSGGMRQRVLIALALAGKPTLVIADEPTTALDVSIQAQILRLLGSLVDELGLSVLLITHDLGVVATVCTRVAVMYAGVVVESGSARDIFKSPVHPYTVGLLQAVPVAGRERGHLREIPGSIPNFLSPPPGCRFHPRCPQASARCKEAVPIPFEVEPGHDVACFLYE